MSHHVGIETDFSLLPQVLAPVRAVVINGQWPSRQFYFFSRELVRNTANVVRFFSNILETPG